MVWGTTFKLYHSTLNTYYHTKVQKNSSVKIFSFLLQYSCAETLLRLKITDQILKTGAISIPLQSGERIWLCNLCEFGFICGLSLISPQKCENFAKKIVINLSSSSREFFLHFISLSMNRGGDIFYSSALNPLINLNVHQFSSPLSD